MGLCGPSQQETTAQAAQQAAATQFQQNYNTMFAQQQNILAQLNQYTMPLLNGQGITANGFSPAELAAMRASSTDQTSSQFAGAAQALQTKQTQMGLNAALPSGVTLSQAAGLDAQQALAQSQGQEQITIANAQQGVTNYLAGLSSLGGQSSTLGQGVSAAGSQTNSADQAAFNEANTMQQQSFSWSKLLAGALGAAASFIPGVGPIVGPLIASAGGAMYTGQQPSKSTAAPTTADNLNIPGWSTSDQNTVNILSGMGAPTPSGLGAQIGAGG